MRPLQQSEIATLSLRKDKKDKSGAFTGDADEVSLAVLSVVEEASHSLGQHLTVVRDDALLGATDTLQEHKERAGRCRRMSRRRLSLRLATVFLWLGAASISKSPRQRSIPY